MRTALVSEGLSIDKSKSLVCQLLALASAAMVFVASPATDNSLTRRAVGGGATSTAMTSEPGFYQWQPSGSTGGAAHLIDYGEAESAWRHALREAETALRVVRAFDDDFATPEVDSYFQEVDSILAAMPAKPEPQHAHAFAVSLQLARNKFGTDASTFALWSKLARAIDPAAAHRRVPERWVRYAAVEQETTLGWTQADIRVHRAVRDFLAPDADPRSSRT